MRNIKKNKENTENTGSGLDMRANAVFRRSLLFTVYKRAHLLLIFFNPKYTISNGITGQQIIGVIAELWSVIREGLNQCKPSI